MAKENPCYVRGKPKSFKYCQKDISGVYIIINDLSGDFYIGSSIDIGRRMSHHFGDLKNNKNKCVRLQENYNNYSHDVFSFYILYTSDSQEFIRKKELELLEDNHSNPLLLNTSTLNNTWVTKRNDKKVKVYKNKLSRISKERKGSKNPFYGRNHSEETKIKISKVHKGKSNKNCWQSVVVNGVLFENLEQASISLNVPVATISHRTRSKSLLFVNWYQYEKTDQIKIIDERLSFKPDSKPSGLYEIEGVLFFNAKDIMSFFSVKQSTLNYRLNSETYGAWIRII